MTKTAYALRTCLRFLAADIRRMVVESPSRWRSRWRLASRFYEVREKKRTGS
jgi:hypothetical protein